MRRDGGGWRWRPRSWSAVVRGVALAAALLLTAAGCGGGSGPDKTLDEVASWAATARLAAATRAAGSTSARYTRNLLHAAHAELQQNASELRASLDSSKDSSLLAPPDRVRAVAAAAEAEEAVGDMARTADGDPTDASALLTGASSAGESGDAARALADSARAHDKRREQEQHQRR